jgi:hypothetical protein
MRWLLAVLLLGISLPAQAQVVALVDSVSGLRGTQVLTPLSEGQVLTLGSGRITVAHLSGCRVERARGGVLTIRAGGSTVVGGTIEAETLADCIAPSAPTTGDTVVKGPVPVFAWSGGGVLVDVTLVDVSPPQAIWQGRAVAGWIAYDGPPLIRGARYFVEATTAAGRVYGAMFAVDPALDVLSSVATRLVRVDQPGLALGAVVAATRALAP